MQMASAAYKKLRIMFPTTEFYFGSKNLDFCFSAMTITDKSRNLFSIMNILKKDYSVAMGRIFGVSTDIMPTLLGMKVVRSSGMPLSS
jgi:hypothetical protein